MHAQDLLVDDCSDWQAVETICEGLPKLDVITAFALVIKAINSVDGSAFVVASEKEEILRVLDLVSQQQANRLQALFATVHIVSEEKVIRLRRETAILKQAE